MPRLSLKPVFDSVCSSANWKRPQVLIPVLLMLKKDKHGIVNKNLSFIFLNKTVKFTFIIIGYSKVCSARLNF